jgi:hypothetical protein
MTDAEVDIDDQDERGSDDAAIVRRLNKALRIQQKVTTRLNRILSVSVQPGPPEGPGLCDQIIAEANRSIATAEEIKRAFAGTRT